VDASQPHVLTLGGSIGDLYGQRVDEVATRAQDSLVLAPADGSGPIADLPRLGNALPTWSLGLNQQFQWRKWQLAFLVRGDLGHSIANGVRADLEPTLPVNSITPEVNRVRFDDVAPLPSLGWNDYYVENASYLALDYLSLSRRFALGQHGIFTLELAGRNLFWLTNYLGLDPSPRLSGEVPSFFPRTPLVGNQQPAALGIDTGLGLFPVRSVMLGVKLALSE